MHSLYLTLLIFFPALVGILVIPFLSEEDNGKKLHSWATFFAVALFIYSLFGWLPTFGIGGAAALPQAITLPWFPSLGISYALAADGVSMTLSVLTTFLLLMAVIASYTNITKRWKLYYSLVFTLTTAVLGVFLARDAFLFFLFWELELIPMYLLIAIWGGPRRDYAAMKFVLYTLFGSVFMVAGLLGLYFHARSLGMDPTQLFLFDTLRTAVGGALTGGAMMLGTQILIFLALFIAFAIKLPVVPFHTWLPDAHVEAPTPISMLLAGILLKMGAYGMLRLCWGFLPEAAQALAPYLALMAFINIVYTAGVALVQADLKKLIAYSSVSHMGFVLLGLCAMNAVGFNGAVFVMVSHGLVSAALFMCVGTLYVRTHTRMIADFGGMALRAPIIYGFFLFMGLASLGLPFLISFAGESLVFYGAYVSQAFQHISFGDTTLHWSIQTITILSAVGVVLGAAYVLWLLQRVFCGPMPDRWQSLTDATRSEVVVLASLAVLVFYFGVVPQHLMGYFESATTALAKPYDSYHLANMGYSYTPSVQPVASSPLASPASSQQSLGRTQSGGPRE